MIPFTPIELQKRLHEDRVASLRSSMQNATATIPHRTVGRLLVAAGLRLAPDAATPIRPVAGSEPPLRPAA